MTLVIFTLILATGTYSTYGGEHRSAVCDWWSCYCHVCVQLYDKRRKAMGETLKRVAKECKDDDIRTQMNKIKREFWYKSCRATWISNACFVNVVHEEE